MDNKDIKSRIERIFISVLKQKDLVITEELSASDVNGWDSLTHMIIINEIEEAFLIKFKLKELNQLDNIGSLISMVKSKL